MTPDLLDFHYPETPGFKATETSRAAAAGISARAPTLCEAVLRELARSANGLTADECAHRIGESILAIRPRFSELRRKGLIVDSGRRADNDSRRQAIVWVLRKD